jgi:hypothetical protein
MVNPMEQDNDRSDIAVPLTSSECVADLLLAGHPVRVRVQGRSMSPLIQDGAVLTLEPTQGAALRLGDVALYRSADNRLVCHRFLVRRQVGTTTWLGFRGDAFAIPLEWVEGQAVLGRATQRDDLLLDCATRRGVGWIYAWQRWLTVRARIKLGAWRRRLFKIH